MILRDFLPTLIFIAHYENGATIEKEGAKNKSEWNE
jgi:hypothetical protein